MSESTPKVAYLCSSIQLQEQLHKEFPEAGFIIGRSNYDCYDGHGDASQCLHDGEENPCGHRGTCPYQVAKRAMLAKDVHIMNYTYFLYASNYTKDFTDYDLIICDECDMLESELTQFISFSLSQYYIDRFELSPPSKVSSSAKDVDKVWKEWCKETITKISTKGMDALHHTRGTEGYMKAEKQLKSLLSALHRMANDVSKNWIFEHKQKTPQSQFEGYEFKPVWITNSMFEQYFGRHGNRFMMMSGSIPPNDIFLACLGADEDEFQFHRFPSDFPIENRKIYTHWCGSMSRTKQEQSLPNVVARMRQIVEANQDKKTLIHTVSYSLNKTMVDSLNNNRVITHTNSKDKVLMIEKLQKSDKSLVAVSPSCQRGVDLPDDDCRLQIAVKAPFLSLGDKFTKARAYSGKIGQRWYTSMACQELIQMVGRGVRSKDDYCEMHLLDSDLCRLLVENKSLFPKWFTDAVEKV